MTSEENVLQQVTAFADKCHDKQIRRYTGDRYIVHPIRVMEVCREYTNDITILTAAILHDVLEDTPTTRDEIMNFLLGLLSPEQAEQSAKFVVDLTDVFIKKNYPAWNRRKRKNKEVERMAQISAEAQTIKYADIIDNAPEITEKEPDFAERYLGECLALLEGMETGNADLRKRALETVNNCLRQLKSAKN
jgi:(p)ppGpp synthase/HD superfamily hydrolase